MKKLTLSLLLIFFVLNCQQTQINSNISPREVVDIWLESLQKKDSKKIYQLIEPTGRKTLEENLKLYLQTVQDLTGDSKDIQKILSLNNEDFLKAFLVWEETIAPSRSFDYSISEIQTSSKSSVVTILVGDKIKKIHLLNINDSWYIKADHLEDYSTGTNEK